MLSRVVDCVALVSDHQDTLVGNHSVTQTAEKLSCSQVQAPDKSVVFVIVPCSDNRHSWTTEGLLQNEWESQHLCRSVYLLTFVLNLVSGLRRLVLDVLYHVIDFGFILEEKRANDAGVNQNRAIGGSWSHAPHQENTLGKKTRVLLSY